MLKANTLLGPLLWLPMATTATIGGAQQVAQERTAARLTVFGANTLIGALVAVSGAWRGARDLRRAAVQGAGGGALVFVGKSLGPDRGTWVALSGYGLTAIGSSVVSNAAQGKDLASNLLLPAGPLRIHLRSEGRFGVRVAVNAYDTFVLVNRLSRPGLEFDLERTIHTGAVHFTSSRRPIVHDVPGTVDGVTDGSIVVLSAFALDPGGTQSHEMVHVKQDMFLSQNVDSPVENAIRERWAGFERIPAWIELGVFWPALLSLEQRIAGRDRGPLVRLQQAEARVLERRVIR